MYKRPSSFWKIRYQILSKSTEPFNFHNPPSTHTQTRIPPRLHTYAPSLHPPSQPFLCPPWPSSSISLRNKDTLMDCLREGSHFTLLFFLNKSRKDELYLSFNGGKDATIVLFLTYIAMSRYNNKKLLKREKED